MCSNSAPAPVADPGIGIAAQQQVALGKEYLDYAKGQGDKQDALGREYLDFAKDQFKISAEKQDEFTKTAQEASNFFTGMAKEDRARWENVFKPLEDSFIKTANEYDTPDKQAEMAAAAKADVASAAASERASTERRETAMGINPASGRYTGIDRAVGLGETLASVNAQNAAREGVRNKALALKSDAINLGRGLSSQAGNAEATGVGIAAQPLTQLNASQPIMGAGYGGAFTGAAGAASTTGAGFTGDIGANKAAAGELNSVYKTQAGIYDTDAKLAAANAAGVGQFLGTIGGAGLQYFKSSKKSKTDRKDVADGESLDAVKAMPVQTYRYKESEGDGGAQSHVGPMAEEFTEATGHGDGTRIAVQDAIGITMGAIGDLDRKVDRIAQAVGLGAPRKTNKQNRAGARQAA